MQSQLTMSCWLPHHCCHPLCPGDWATGRGGSPVGPSFKELSAVVLRGVACLLGDPSAEGQSSHMIDLVQLLAMLSRPGFRVVDLYGPQVSAVAGTW